MYLMHYVMILFSIILMYYNKYNNGNYAYTNMLIEICT